MASSALNPAPLSAFDHLGPIEAFILHEAHLLDERRFTEWSELFTEDGYYWAPARAGQTSPLDEVSLFYDNRTAMATRLRRLGHPSIHSQIPPPTSVRLVSNLVIETHDHEMPACTVRSKFMMFEYRAGVPDGEQRIFGGTYRHRLVVVGSDYRIAWKQAVLANADGRFGALFTYF